MQAVVSDNESKMSNFQGEVSKYQADIGKEVQEYTQILDKESKEYQSKWYTNAVAWAISLKQEPVVSKDQLPDSNDGNDLPF